MKIVKLVLLVFALAVSFSSFAQGEDLKPFKSKDNGKWGYKDAKGAVFIAPQYDDAKTFSEGVAVVKSGEKYGMINLQGEFVIKPEYKIGIAYHNGYYILNHEIIDRSGKHVETSGLKPYNGISHFLIARWIPGSNLVIVRPEESDRHDFLMDMDGRIIRLLNDDEGMCGDFHDGLCLFMRSDKYDFMDSKYGYMDTTGKKIIRPKYKVAFGFSEGLAAVSSKRFERIGSIDEAWIMNPNYALNNVLNNDLKMRCNSGYINTEGNWVIKPQYYYAASFYNGLAFVIKNGFIGLIDKDGNYAKDFTSSFSSSPFLQAFIRRFIMEGYTDFFLGFNPLEVKYQGNDKILIEYRSYNENTGRIDQLRFVIDERGELLYFINDYDEIVDKDGNLIEKPNIQWSNNLAITDQPQYVMTATINSGSKINYCKVFLNNVEIRESNAPGGSSIVEEQKGGNNISISRTLFLFEGTNTIKIEAKNTGGITTEERKIVYTPTKQEPVVAKALIEWGDLPTTTTDPRLELDAMVRSTVSDVSCRVSLNGVEVPKTKGSSIVEDSKELEYKYKLEIQRTLTLNVGDNTIAIEVRDAKGKLFASGEKHVIYTKPALATIVWENMPTTTVEKQITLSAQIISDTPIEYYSILKDGKLLKKVSVNTIEAPGGSNIAEDPKNGLHVNESVELAEGDNSFVIEVKNAGGIIQSQTRKVSYKQKEKRIALVIGNKIYNNNPYFPSLRNPVNDATALENKLKRFGFTVLHVHNGTKEMMNEEIDAFIREAAKSDMALFYYSGHGMQIKSKGNDNYMIPVVPPQYVEDIDDACISANDIVERLQKVNCQAGIILLDACRVEPNLPSKDNPNAPRGTGGVKGLSSMSPQGFITVFAAADNCEAYDGIGNNSPFMEAMLECFDKYSQLPIESFLKKLRELTYVKSEQRQWPYVYEGLRGDFYFRNINIE